ncbi:ArsR family transcriptional regulator [Granulicoccus phenolivorans]|uniref:arsenate reductase/protein-tyrosine-phosphatase family protein n=1 Tax=Granulicoccus phenolivorans TaxID=266854 RepID=UPI00041F4856|nr:ArsR family transcriptional regulator [Granulicoccus phenolivorans]
MSTEAPSLEQRVERYAALADPVRLRIVDLLTLGDAAPVELQRALGISSSLLAHHLRLLETAGLVARHRSEGDRRRIYLHRIPAATEALQPPPALTARRVLFVCTANSARSQLAAALWHDVSRVPVASAGTHPAARLPAGTIAAAERHRLTLLGHRPRAVEDVLRTDDLVISVCDTAHEELEGRDRLHWSVSDPAPDGSAAAFDATVAALTTRIHVLVPHLIKE